MKKYLIILSLIIMVILSILSTAVYAKTDESIFKGQNDISENGYPIDLLNSETINPDTTTDTTINKDNIIIPLKTLEPITKNDYYKKVLNSVDYYNYASGRITTNMLNGTEEIIEYNVNMEDCSAYQKVTGRDFNEEVFVEKSQIHTIDNFHRVINSGKMIAYTKSDEADDYSALRDSDTKDRITYTTFEQMESGNPDACVEKKDISDESKLIPVYHYRLNVTNLQYASTVSLFPQEMAFGLLSKEDLWDISDKTIYLGRTCTVLRGITEKEYGSKLNIEQFVMTVDDKTGIILSFEGYDKNGNVSNYTRTTDINFEKIEIKKFNSANYENYKTE